MNITNQMTVKEQISEIVRERYKNYEPAGYRCLKKIHLQLHGLMGDQRFLEWLRKQQAINPGPPVYQHIKKV